MPNRRDVLQGGIALTTLPLVASAAWESSDAPRVALAPYRILFDDRFAESRRFGAEIARLGGATRAFSGDVTELWYEELDVRWRREPIVVAGMTRHGPLFCLERLAWDVGMRVAYRAEHRRASDGSIAHVIVAPAETLRWAVRLHAANPDWVRNSARIVMQGRHHSWSPAMCECGSAAPLSADADDPLISWIIAPRARGRSA
jgi:hypothetical protein